MKLLLDTCVWGGCVAALKQAGHDVIWTGDWPADPGDEAILALAFAENRTLITIDKDFGELAILHQQPHYGIMRLVNFPARQQASVSLTILAKYEKELLAGSLITVESHRVRIRPPDFDQETNP